jgi:hypothetical protein
VLDIVDAVLHLIEPGGSVSAETALRTATSGTVVDHTGARPFEVEQSDNHLFAWPVTDRHEVFEAGDPPSTRERFALTLMYVADASEQARAKRLREVSVALDAKSHLYLSRIAVSRTPPDGSPLPWSELAGEVNPDTIRGFNVRAVGLRVSGWRYLN